MKISMYQVDAFTNTVFCGNPAAVCPVDAWLPTETLQAIAAENMLPETVFFLPTDKGYHIRWFTPEIEMDLCGHATLASAHVIFNHLGFSGDTIHFESAAGPLQVHRVGERIELDFPSRPGTPENLIEPLSTALSSPVVEVLRSRDVLVLLPSVDAVLNVQPDYQLLMQHVKEPGGIIVTAPGRDCDFVSRYFSPECSIKEDPVTGSAHCTLIPYWANKLGKNVLHARQISPRGGELFCELRGNRVAIAGHAVTFLEGVISVP